MREAGGKDEEVLLREIAEIEVAAGSDAEVVEVSE